MIEGYILSWKRYDSVILKEYQQHYHDSIEYKIVHKKKKSKTKSVMEGEVSI